MKNIFLLFGLISSASLIAMEQDAPAAIGLQFNIPELRQIDHDGGLELKYVNILARKLHIDYASSHFQNPKARVIKRFTEEVIKEAVLKRDAQLPPTEIGTEWQEALKVIKFNARKLGYIATGQQNTELSPEDWKIMWRAIKDDIEEQTRQPIQYDLGLGDTDFYYRLQNLQNPVTENFITL